jgi:protein-disulfide isomerase
MSMRPIRYVLAAALAATLATGCNKEKSPATNSAATSAAACGDVPADTVVATYGNQKVTMGDLNERLKEPLANLDKQKYQLRKQGLEGLVVEKLVQDEAKKKGQTEEQFLKAEIDDKVPQPSDEKVKEVFEGAKDRLPPGTTFEQMKPQIVEFLTSQQKQERAKALFEELKKNNNVKFMLPAPKVERQQVAATGPSKGPENAPVTMVEFSDFECPYCGRAKDTVDQVTKQYGDKVRLVFRNFPLSFHPHAQKAAEAAMCANDQGKFWEMHDVLFANQKALEPEQLKKYAADLKLDTAKFNKCLDSGEKAEAVKADQEAGTKAGVNGTPAFFINGIPLSGAIPFEDFKTTIDGELQAKQGGGK